MERKINEKVQSRMHGFMPDLNEFFEKLENQQEKSLIELFSEVGIKATVKTDKYSLPHQGEVVFKAICESDVQHMYLRYRFFRPILAKMLELNATKIRFYLHYETFCGDDDNGAANIMNGKSLPIFFNMGFKYTFRYYIH